MKALPLVPMLMLLVPVFGAQQPTPSWSIAKPIVDKWDKEYREAERSVAARDKIVGEIHQLLLDHPADVWAYEAAALGLNHLNKNGDAVAVIRDYLHRFPDDDTLTERVWFFFSNWGSVEDMSAVPAPWRQNVRYWQSLLRVYVRAQATPDLLEQVGAEVLTRIPPNRDFGGNERIRIAEIWIEHGVSARAAERIAREAVSISEIGDRASVIPTNSQPATVLKRLMVVNVNRSTLGWALYQQGRYSEALAELQRAVAICEKEAIVSRYIYFRLGQTLEKLNRRDRALEAYFNGIAWEDREEATLAAISSLYLRMHGSIDGLETLKRTRVNDLLSARAAAEEDLVRTVDEDLGRFEPVDDHGRPFDVIQYRGKIVIVEFWAIWCGVCRLTMRQTDELQRKLADQVVVIAWSSDAEQEHAQAVQFIKQMRYSFITVFGAENRRSLHIPFLPARLIIDRTGRVRVMEFGYTAVSAAKFEQKLKAILANPR